jgi:hypothetical protein
MTWRLYKKPTGKSSMRSKREKGSGPENCFMITFPVFEPEILVDVSVMTNIVFAVTNGGAKIGR